jgi:hypothetical protein
MCCLPPGVNPIAVKYIYIYIYIISNKYKHIWINTESGPEQEQSNRNKWLQFRAAPETGRTSHTITAGCAASWRPAWGKQKECCCWPWGTTGPALVTLTYLNRRHETADGKPVLLTAKQWMRQTEGQEVVPCTVHSTRYLVAMAKITAGIGNRTLLLVDQPVP